MAKVIHHPGAHSIQEIAEKIGISLRTLFNWRREGLESFKGALGAVYIPAAALERKLGSETYKHYFGQPTAPSQSHDES